MTIRNKTIKRRHIWNLLVVIGAFAALSIAPIAMITKASVENFGGAVPILVRNANLASPTGTVNPHGFAEYQLYASGNRELEIEVEDMSFAAGTSISMFVNGNSVGSAPVDTNGKARLKLRTQDGQTVPVTNDGDTVEARNGAAVVVNGVLGGGGPNPSPSPTGSPSGSPSPSPTGSPTGSPSPSPTGSPSPSPTGSPSPSPTGSPGDNDIYAALNGPTINGVLPRGYAQYEIHSSRTELEARIRQINLPSGSNFSVFIDNIQVGQMSLESDGESRLRLRSDRGDTVPVITGGETIEIRQNGTVILSGVFSSVSPSPSPSPTGSPSPTPTPNGGRYFETHPSGNGMVPTVNTNARGEVKVTLNAAENEATIQGEFHDLSSAQTSARIEADLGDLILVHDFGTIGGTNGNFATATIPVTRAQVDQIRAGLWIATIASQNNTGGEIRGTLIQHANGADFDGDGSNDLAVFRPGTGVWYAQNSNGFSSSTHGTAADIPVSADYDGDGRTDTAIYKNVNGSGVWEIKHSSDGGTSVTQFGLASDKPVRGDFDGDGLNDLAVYRPSTGVWYVRKSNNTGYIIVQFGSAEDIPVAGDFDGDGKADVAVYRPSTGVWYRINSATNTIKIDQWGINGDIPSRGDFDGDGKNDLAVYRPSSGVWYIYRSSDNNWDVAQFGIAEDIPVAGLYDGDNRADIAVFRPSTGHWYIYNSSNQTFSVFQFGLTGDIPTIAQ